MDMSTTKGCIKGLNQSPFSVFILILVPGGNRDKSNTVFCHFFHNAYLQIMLFLHLEMS